MVIETTEAVSTALRYDSAPHRRQAILDAVGDEGFVSVTALSKVLGVSDMTVRRDLRKLEKQGRVRVVHGGVSPLSGSGHSRAFSGRAELQAASKRAIGRVAASQVPPGGTVAIDAGTTTYAAMQALPSDFSGTVVTHSIPVMQLLLSRATTRAVGLGGELLSESQAFVGSRTVAATEGLKVSTFFLGAAAVDANGVYVATDNERPTKLALMDIADDVTLLIDSTKFTSNAPVLLCGWERISALITDDEPPADVNEATRRHGIRTILVPQGTGAPG